MTRRVHFEHLWTPAEGWRRDVVLGIDAAGRVSTLAAAAACDAAIDERVHGFAVPGMPNTHSHAFQRALAGRCEIGGTGGGDNLWTWRERMYRLAGRIDPEQLEALASFAYMEMLEHGFTRVAEFHYLHHAPGGARYARRGEMALRLAQAAEHGGIDLLLLPTLYAHAGIGRAPLPEQARFVHAEVLDFVALLDDVQTGLPAGAPLGIALHSLRAVSPAELHEAVAAAGARRGITPIHVHVSETVQEVADVQAGLGARPVQWLLDHVALDGRWTLVHATHLDSAECAGLARSGAIASLAPMTEAMLGDGLFPLVEYQHHGGLWAIGTDSHYASGVAAELRMLECGQRLKHARRNVLADGAHADVRQHHSGERLFALALNGCRSFADGLPPLVPGSRADIVVLDADAPALAGHDEATVLDAWLLSGAADTVARVMSAGRWVVEQGRHVHRAAITRAYSAAVRALFA